ncbi:MAG: adenosylcobinamide amidohydrolase [Candidatus Dormibacteria bacterium]
MGAATAQRGTIAAAQRLPASARLHVTSDLLVVESAHPLAIASTAVFGGGLRLGRCIVSVRVPVGYDGKRPGEDICRVAQADGWAPDVGLMTAVSLDRARVAVEVEAGITVAAVVTAGVARPWAAGSMCRRAVAGAGTINLIVLLGASLSPAAALNLIATATEAKVLALLEAGIRTREGEPASGTATDAVVIASPAGGHGQVFNFGGPATPVGWAAARAVRCALMAALERPG